MPFFDADTVAGLARGRGEAEEALDLRGASPGDAREAVARLLERRRFGAPATVLIRIDPAGPESGETLFLPVGRQLLEARRRGLVASVAPVAEPAGGGFLVVTAGRAGGAV